MKTYSHSNLFLVLILILFAPWLALSLKVNNKITKLKFEKVFPQLFRSLANINFYTSILLTTPIYFNHRAAEFNDVKTLGLDFNTKNISSDDTWSYRDYISSAKTDDALNHAYYGRMVRTVYDLLDSDPDSGRYGQSYLNEAQLKQFVEGIYDGYELVDILRTTVDTPNQDETIFGEAASELLSGSKNLNFERYKGNFMGYTLYNKNKKDLAIIFRGTILDREWIQNIDGLGIRWDNNDLSGELKAKACEESRIFKNTVYNATNISYALFQYADGFSDFMVVTSVFLNLFICLFSLWSASEFFQINLIDELVKLINDPSIIAKSQISIKLFLEVSEITFAVICLCAFNWQLMIKFVQLYKNFIRKIPNEPVFQAGFSELYTTPAKVKITTSDQGKLVEIFESPQSTIYKTVQKYINDVKSISISGHSLGCSLAVISAYHVAETVKSIKKESTIPITLVDFACPKVGSPEVFARFPSLNIKHYHYLNRGDIVPIIMTGSFTNGLGYDNNHVVRFDQANLIKNDPVNIKDNINHPTLGRITVESNSNKVLGYIQSFLWIIERSISVPLGSFIRIFTGYSMIPGVIRQDKLSKIQLPIIFGITDQATKVLSSFPLNIIAFFISDFAEKYVQSVPDWHNLEVILYNLLVEVYHAHGHNKNKKVQPELSLINYDGDRITKKIDTLRNFKFVNDLFLPVRPQWDTIYKNDVKRLSKVALYKSKDLLAEQFILSDNDLKNEITRYRNIYLRNINEIIAKSKNENFVELKSSPEKVYPIYY